MVKAKETHQVTISISGFLFKNYLLCDEGELCLRALQEVGPMETLKIDSSQRCGQEKTCSGSLHSGTIWGIAGLRRSRGGMLIAAREIEDAQTLMNNITKHLSIRQFTAVVCVQLSKVCERTKAFLAQHQKETKRRPIERQKSKR